MHCLLPCLHTKLSWRSWGLISKLQLKFGWLQSNGNLMHKATSLLREMCLTSPRLVFLAKKCSFKCFKDLARRKLLVTLLGLFVTIIVWSQQLGSIRSVISFYFPLIVEKKRDKPNYRSLVCCANCEGSCWSVGITASSLSRPPNTQFSTTVEILSVVKYDNFGQLFILFLQNVTEFKQCGWRCVLICQHHVAIYAFEC